MAFFLSRLLKRLSPNSSAPMEARFLSGIRQIAAAEWNRLAGADYPFIRHEFLAALEDSGAVAPETGWQPCHLVMSRRGKTAAVMPLYLKTHSYGEYVFDWGWADAWRRRGLEYYPKLLTAIPFTPAAGPRLCAAKDEDRGAMLAAALNAVRQFAEAQGISSWHLLFPEAEDVQLLQGIGSRHGMNGGMSGGLSVRHANQFHWRNRNYRDFDEFLATFNSRKRKTLLRERRRVREQGIALSRMEGRDITEAQWNAFFRFYQRTYAKRSGHRGYLNREFFLRVGEAMPEHCLMINAHCRGELVAAALCYQSPAAIFGRHWGCEQELDCLHFEACYYQGIEYCIERGIPRFDSGAQGEHKIQRGFEPVRTHSCHWIADPELAQAVRDFTLREERHISAYAEQAEEYLPYKRE